MNSSGASVRRVRRIFSARIFAVSNSMGIMNVVCFAEYFETLVDPNKQRGNVIGFKVDPYPFASLRRGADIFEVIAVGLVISLIYCQSSS
jgi:hypothetical protein